MPAVMPRFAGGGLDVLVATVDHVQAAVRRELWSIDRVRAEFGRRSAIAILDDGGTFAFAPCPERTLVATAILRGHGIEPTLVYHERRVFGFGPSTAHFAIEVDVDGEPYMADFGTWESRLLPGRYRFAADWEETITLDRIPDPDVDPRVTTVQGLVGGSVTDALDMTEKLEWYRSQLEKPRDGILTDRIAFAEEFSVVRTL